MARSLDSINCATSLSTATANRKQQQLTSIKRVLAKLLLELHEVSAHKRDLAAQTSVLGIFRRAVDLELVVVESNNFHVGETGDFEGGAADTAPDVEDTHSRTKAHLGSEVVLVTSESSRKRLALVEPTEVERLRPAVLIQLSRTVVVA